MLIGRVSFGTPAAKTSKASGMLALQCRGSEKQSTGQTWVPASKQKHCYRLRDLEPATRSGPTHSSRNSSTVNYLVFKAMLCYPTMRSQLLTFSSYAKTGLDGALSTLLSTCPAVQGRLVTSIDKPS